MSNDIDVIDEAATTITTTSTTAADSKTANAVPSSPPNENADEKSSTETIDDAKKDHTDNNNAGVIVGSSDEVTDQRGSGDNTQQSTSSSVSSSSSSSLSPSEDSVTAVEPEDDCGAKGRGKDHRIAGGSSAHYPMKKTMDQITTAEEEVQTASSCSSSMEGGPDGQSQDQLHDIGNDGNTTVSGDHAHDVDTESQQQQQQQQDDQTQQQQTPQIELLQQQIISLTLERDSAESQLQSNKLSNIDNEDKQLQKEEAQERQQQQLALIEMEAKFQIQTTQKAELEHKYHTLQNKYESHLQNHSTLEDEIEKSKASIIQITTSKTSIENEVTNLRTLRDTNERTQAVLHNRLNDAKKKEAQRSTTANRLQIENTRLTEQLAATKTDLKRTTASKDKLDSSLEKLKRKVVERVKASEAALVEERNLNEERKRKMKAFVEHKAEELRKAKILNDELRAELVETTGALENVRNKVETVGDECTRVQNRNRDLVREVTRMKKNSEQLHQMGDNLELELHKSTQETEEHRNKRQTAKHELMAMLKKLEAEQAVCLKLKDSVKFTFTPKALSQQQLLTESLQDFEADLLKLSRRIGKPLPPSPLSEGDSSEGNVGAENSSLGVSGGDVESSSRHGSTPSKRAPRLSSRSELDTSRLLANLECETQSVSKCIMALGSAVERLHVLLDDSGDRSCVSTINSLFLSMAMAREDKEVVPQGGSSAGTGMGIPGSRTNGERHGLVQSQNR